MEEDRRWTLGASSRAPVGESQHQGSEWINAFFCFLVWYLVAKSCWTLWDPRDYGLPGSSVHGVFWARILEWAVFSLSRGSSPPGDLTRVSWVAGRFSTAEPPGINERMALAPLSACKRNPAPETGLQNESTQVPGSESRGGISVLKSKGRVGHRDLHSEA